jgi:hypothetical protein
MGFDMKKKSKNEAYFKAQGMKEISPGYWASEPEFIGSFVITQELFPIKAKQKKKSKKKS